MKLHPALDDPLAVLVWRTQVSSSPTWGEYRRAARQVLAVLRLDLEGEKAVLKPNVTSGEHYADPETGITTHPAFLWGLADYLREHGARRGGIYVLEDPRDRDDNEPRHWRGTGYLEMAEATGAKLRTTTSYTCVKVQVPDPLVHAERRVSRLATDPHAVLINVPKLKTHNLGITTLCLKNQMGVDSVFERHYCSQAMRELPADRCFPERPRQEWMDRALHERWQEGLARRLADLAKVVRPRLNVVEGIVGRDGTGFNRGTNYPLGLVVAGVNMVAVDSVASYLMGFDPQQLIYLRVASAAGLGCIDLARLHIYTACGDDLVPVTDLQPWRAHPAFTVYTDTREG